MVEIDDRPQTFESIKLMKMSKGYQWEIRINPIPTNKLSDIDGNPLLNKEKEARLNEVDIQRLERLDNEMQRKWGSTGEFSQ